MLTTVTPEFSALLAGHDLEALAAEEGPVFGLDADLRLAMTAGGGRAFALANEGEQALKDYPLGRPVLDAVPEPLRAFYEAGLAECMASGEVWTHEYTCSSPELYRRFQMQVYPLPGGAGVLIVNTLVMETPHPDEGPAPVVRDDVVTQCCHCRRFRTEGGEDGLGRWTFFGGWLNEPPFRVSHGLCAACMEHHYPS